MSGVSRLGQQKDLDVYEQPLRGMAITQISFMLGGTFFLGVILESHHAKTLDVTHGIEGKIDASHSVLYPVDPSKDVVVEVHGGKIKISTGE